MVDKFNKDLFVRNINFLVKSNKEVKIGQLEEDIGVSKGYFARLNKVSDAVPSVDLVIKVAHRFNVSTDILLSVAMDTMTSTETYLYNFLQKLMKDTENEKLEWGLETAENLNALKVINGNWSPHPFFFPAMDIIRTLEGKAPKDCFFNSDTFKTQTKIHGNCYFLRLNNGGLLFLADVSKKYSKGKDASECAKEVWIRTNNSMRFLCSDRNENFTSIINSLFSVITEYFRHPLLEEDYRSSIDSFMNNEVNDHTIKTTTMLFPEEVPFAGGHENAKENTEFAQ